MKKAKRIILILLPVALLCGVLLLPLVRFPVCEGQGGSVC